ncbi:MAG: hypothetical protein Ct9H300mP25_07700 [Acidobacteriota bacterium]|nr:MAG: hypothetical protein Ct9H300mP25_07700 [Acidobacteriota bacterium]
MLCTALRDTHLRTHVNNYVLGKFLADTERAMELHSDGSYQRIPTRGKHTPPKKNFSRHILILGQIFRTETVSFLVAIVIRLIRPLNRNTDIIGLIFR